ncbi:MAG TPA: orotate phosphoribosyltransferase [Actinomycetota bacterium]|nr:orotate phosphoribosyltransferase [Actinomycetota bacterium]
MTATWEAAVEVLRTKGLERRAQAFQLVSGEWSHDYVDCKRALAQGSDLATVAQAVLDLVASEGIDFDAVGGLTMGADPIAHAVAVLSGKRWFSVRKTPKKHGRQRLLEGAELDGTTRVLLVDDIVTTGGSILDALDAIEEIGAPIALAVTLCDRGETGRPRLEARGVRYRPLMTYKDMGIVPVGVTATEGAGPAA